MGGVQDARTVAEIRQDLRFTVDYGAGRGSREYAYLYNLTDLLVQVRWYNRGHWYERYGVLVDFEQAARYGEDSYILEIPTTETDPEKIKEAQVATIKAYVDEMRTEWKTLLDHVAQGDRPMVVGYWDELHKWLDSAEGRWDLLRAFHNNTMPGTMPVREEDREAASPRRTPSTYKSFYHWLIAKEPSLAELQRRTLSSVEQATPDLQRHWMPLLCGQEHEIFLDWALPYICWAEDWKVSHFKTQGGAAFLYYPFHDFEYQSLPGTKLTPPPARSRPDPVVRLAPTNYAPLAYWSYLIERIDLSRAQAYELLRPYYTYVTNLGLIHAVFANYGPLRDLSQPQLEALIRSAEADEPRWSGGVGDTWWSGEDGHRKHIALGMRAIQEAQRLFAGVIKKEALAGRTGNLAVSIDADCHELMRAVYSRPSEQIYEDLWAHNRDAFGYDLFFEKANLLLSQSAAADDAYERFMRANLYEHPVLDDPAASRDAPPDSSFWAAMAYRTVSLTLALWQMYYHVRETKLATASRGSTPSAAAVAEWFRQSTPGPAAGSVTWWLHDQGQRKLANYLLRGGKLEQLQRIEAEVLREIHQIVGRPHAGPITAAQIDQIRDGVIKAKMDGLIREAGLDPDRPTRTLAPIHIAINTYILAYAIGAADQASWSAEAKYGVVAAAVGLASDGMGYMVFRLWKIQGTLSRSALAAAAAGRGAARTALALGALEGLGGGAGGALGILWYAYMGVTDFQAGRRKDAVLDAVAAAGVAITMTGLFLDSTVVGVVPGIVCNIVGVSMIIVAEVIKIFSLWQNQPEEYVEALFTRDLPEGAQRLEHWFSEHGSGRVVWDWRAFPDQEVKALTERLDAFLVDMDTFDMFQPTMGGR